ncbi:MAG: nucleotidyltransferase domain-containing protein [Defluviitaleaceae bacterium]|nr:nucleotidyltransferase domain-containing protein [Defluviitaleaceae bacterium]
MTQKDKHLQALNSFAKKIIKDPNAIALLLYGSLAYGDVWKKSDLDLELIVRDGSISQNRHYFFEEKGVFGHLELYEISAFKKGLQRIRGGFDHGKYGKGKLVFSKDDALSKLFEEARKIGEEDAPKAFAARVSELTNWMNKAEKHITVTNEPLYAQRFLQLCAPIVADMEMLRNKENPSRESILRARQLNPDLMHEIFVMPSTTAMSEADIRHTLKILDDYLMQHISWWSKHIIRFLNDGETKTISQISKHCVGPDSLAYLRDKGIVIGTTQSTRLYKNSKITIDEYACVYIGEEPGHE